MIPALLESLSCVLIHGTVVSPSCPVCSPRFCGNFNLDFPEPGMKWSNDLWGIVLDANKGSFLTCFVHRKY